MVYRWADGDRRREVLSVGDGEEGEERGSIEYGSVELVKSPDFMYYSSRALKESSVFMGSKGMGAVTCTCMVSFFPTGKRQEMVYTYWGNLCSRSSSYSFKGLSFLFA